MSSAFVWCSYVSFVDIFVGKGLAELEEPWGEAGAMGWGTLLFFSGMAVTWLLHALVHAATAYLLPPLDEKDLEVWLHLN